MKVGATGLMALTLAMVLAAFAPSAIAGPIDSDFDGIIDDDDNCPNSFNPLQENDDNDDVGDACDNCLGVDNVVGGGLSTAIPNQCDTDGDGYGNACDGDYNQDNGVGIPDFNIFRAAFNGGPATPNFAEADFNCDGGVGIPDFNAFRDQFLQTTPGPSGGDCAGSMPGMTGYCDPIVP